MKIYLVAVMRYDITVFKELCPVWRH